MVSISTIRSSNSQIASTYPSGLVAVFVGATSGIGYFTLKSFATATKSTKSRIYFIGRSQSAGERITSELQTINPDSTFTFIQCDVSLLKNVDEVCKTITAKEKLVNLLVLSAGVLTCGQTTDEGLDLMLATAYYSRNRFIANFLPLLKTAYNTPITSPGNAEYGAVLSRVITVFAGAHEGKFYDEDITGSKVPFIKARGHMCSLTTLALTHFAKETPEVSFIHSYPGPVKTGIGRGMNGIGMRIFRRVFEIMAPLICIPADECGDRHLFEMTSSLYSSLRTGNLVFEGEDGDQKTHGKVAKNGWERPTDGVGDKAEKDIDVTRAKGTDGIPGRGVYSVMSNCEPAGEKIVKVLDGLKKKGMVEKVWEHTTGEFRRITGSDSI